MQLLSSAITKSQPTNVCATQMIETIPLVMQFMRRQMRQASRHELSIPQLRTLYFVSLHERPSLSDAADFIGLSLPAMSRLVDLLVRKSLLSRTACPNDRRHIRLGITARGQSALDVAWNGCHEKLVEEVEAMTIDQRDSISAAMEILRSTFDPEINKD
jgi:DNA-binding MarR family transcriptional regulator